jgi:hypothetical protein
VQFQQDFCILLKEREARWHLWSPHGLSHDMLFPVHMLFGLESKHRVSLKTVNIQQEKDYHWPVVDGFNRGVSAEAIALSDIGCSIPMAFRCTFLAKCHEKVLNSPHLSICAINELQSENALFSTVRLYANWLFWLACLQLKVMAPCVMLAALLGIGFGSLR